MNNEISWHYIEEGSQIWARVDNQSITITERGNWYDGRYYILTREIDGKLESNEDFDSPMTAIEYGENYLRKGA